MGLHCPVRASYRQEGTGVTWPDVKDTGRGFILNFFPFFSLHFLKAGGLCLHSSGRLCDNLGGNYEASPHVQPVYGVRVSVLD